MTETYYDLLGVTEDATQEEIDAAFRKRVRETHPDRSDDPRATERMKRINRAREVLSDDAERRRYDRMGHEAYVGDGPSADSSRSPERTGQGRRRSGDPDSSGSGGGRRRGADGASPGDGGMGTGGGAAAGSSTGYHWDPWAGADPFDGSDPVGGPDPFDGTDPFGGDGPFDEAGPYGDRFDPSDPFDETEGSGSDSTWTGASSRTTGDARDWRVNWQWEPSAGAGESGREATGQGVEWPDGHDHDRATDDRRPGSLRDRVVEDFLDSTPAKAWAIRTAASALLAGAATSALAAVGGPVPGFVTLLVVLGVVAVTFLGYEAAVERVRDPDPPFDPDRVPEGKLARAVGANLVALGLMSLGAVGGGEWLGLEYAGPVTVWAVVLFLLVGPTVGLAAGGILAFLGAVLGRPFGGPFDGTTTLGLVGGVALTYSALAVFFFTNIGGRWGSVLEPPGAAGATGPWLSPLRVGPLYVGGAVDFFVAVGLVGGLAVSTYYFLTAGVTLPWYDRGYAVRPDLWDLGLALPLTAAVWVGVFGVASLDLPAVPSLSAFVPPVLALPITLSAPTVTPPAWSTFLVCGLPTLLGGSYLLRRRLEERVGKPRGRTGKN